MSYHLSTASLSTMLSPFKIVRTSFTYKYKFSLCKVWNTVLCKSRCKTCFGNFVNISAALEPQSLSASRYFSSKAHCVVTVILNKFKCISLRTNKCKRNRLAPHNACAAPADCHCVKFIGISACYKRPILADKVKMLSLMSDGLIFLKSDINILLKFCSCFKIDESRFLFYYFVPVEPKPPSPRSVSESSLTSVTVGTITGAITICATLSNGSTV